MCTNVVYFRVMWRLCRREWNWLWNWCVKQHSWDPWQWTMWSRRVTSDFNSVFLYILLISMPFSSPLFFLFLFFPSFLAHPVPKDPMSLCHGVASRRPSVRPPVRPSVRPQFSKMLLLRHFSTDFDSDCFIR